MKVIKGILNAIKKAEYFILVLLFVIIVITTFLQVIGRYTPLPFSGVFEEIATFAFVWATMIGAGTCVREGGHMSIDLLVTMLPGKASKKIAKIWSDIVAILVSGGIIYAAMQLLPKVKRAGMLSGSLQLPLWIQNLSVPIGAALILLWAIVALVEDIVDIAGKRLPDAPKE